MLPETLISGAPAKLPRLEGPIVASGVRYEEDGVERIVSLDLAIAPGEHVAVVGAGDSAKDDVARLLARLADPAAGRLTVGAMSLPDVHVAVTGSRIAYASRNAHVFSGTLFHNLVYGLKHREVAPATYEGEAARAEEARRRDARASGNTTDDINASWIDVEVTGVDDPQAHGLEVLRVVAMDEELFAFGLASRGSVPPELEALVLEARARLRDRVRSPELAPLVELFDRDRYLENATVAENLLFGTAIDPAFAQERLAANPAVRKLLDDMGLTAELEDAGIKVARLMIELFADEPADSPLFAEYSFISPEDLDDFRALLRRVDEKGRSALPDRSHEMLLSLTFKLMVARHRIGVPDEAMQERLVAARHEFARRFADRGVVEFADPARYTPSASIRDNIVYGRAVYEQARAQEHLTELVREVAREVGMEAALIRRGLDYDVGASGARLSYSQKQRLAIARALIKNPDLLVLDEPTSGLDPALERRVVAGVLESARGRTVIWTLGHPTLAQSFPRVLVLAQGHLVEDGPYDRLAKEGRVLPKLLG
jgi:energy-coupling factor transporter ATP-binding protein EcfA2